MTRDPRTSTPITSPDNPRIKAVVKLRAQAQRRRRGLLVVETVRDLGRGLEMGLGLKEVFLCPALLGPQALDQVQALVQGQDPRPPCFQVTEPLLAKMAYRQNPQGVIATFQQPAWDLEQLAAPAGLRGSEAPGLWLLAVGISKPGNLGAMARSAAAAGCRGLLLAESVVDPFNPNAIRASAGAVFSLPIVGAPAEKILGFLDDQGARAIAAITTAPTPYTAVDLRGPTAIVVGPEDRGLGASWGARLQRQGGLEVSIPMAPRTGVDSLNAATAAAILLFEAARQRSTSTSSAREQDR